MVGSPRPTGRIVMLYLQSQPILCPVASAETMPCHNPSPPAAIPGLCRGLNGGILEQLQHICCISAAAGQPPAGLPCRHPPALRGPAPAKPAWSLHYLEPRRGGRRAMRSCCWDAHAAAQNLQSCLHASVQRALLARVAHHRLRQDCLAWKTFFVEKIFDIFTKLFFREKHF